MHRIKIRHKYNPAPFPEKRGTKEKINHKI